MNTPGLIITLLIVLGMAVLVLLGSRSTARRLPPTTGNRTTSHWTPVEADGPVTTASWRDPPRLHPHWDPSHAYAITASPGDRIS